MNNHTQKKGYVTLTSGHVFEGKLTGKSVSIRGEVVFHTGMTGYQEVLSDPGYAGQIVVFTYPLIGNCGITEEEYTSLRPSLAGIVVSELCEMPSHYSAAYSLTEWAEYHQIPILSGVDTREITKLVRTHGYLLGAISDQPLQPNELGKAVPGSESLQPLVAQVSTQKIVTYPGEQEHVVVIDLGMKRAVLEWLLSAGCRVTVVPYHTSLEQITALRPDGLIFSNGPGDPAELLPYCNEWRQAAEQIPTLGIGLGHQVVALMFGAQTKRLSTAHRGSNHPVKELSTGKVYMTSQNHGFAVVEESLDQRHLAVTYRHVNDGSVEGVRHVHLPICGVQFHPAGHLGTGDTSHIFANFLKSLQVIGAKHYA